MDQRRNRKRIYSIPVQGGKYAKLTKPALDKRIKIYAADAHKKWKDNPGGV